MPTTCDPTSATDALRVLLIEDDPEYATLVMTGLKEAEAIAVRLQHAPDLDTGLAKLDVDPFDVILLDLSLPDARGLDSLSKILEVTDAVPVVVLTAIDDEHLASDALHLGAQDYLIKANIDPHALVRAIHYAMKRQHLVDELKRASRAEKEIKEKFFSHVSHELRTPLTAVLQFVTILQDGLAGELNEQQAEYLGIVRRNCDQLRRMISTLMDATRADTGKLTFEMELFDLGSVLQEAVEAVQETAQHKKIDLSLQCTTQRKPVFADRARLTQVAFNLIENAIKFTTAPGSVRVTLESDPDQSELLRVSVRDTGCGIPEDALDDVFDRLFQVGGRAGLKSGAMPGDNAIRSPSRNGLGLGLYICREIVRRHGGEIDVESQVGEGSCFSFTIPAHSLEAAVRRVVEIEGAVQSSVTLLTIAIRARSAKARAKGPRAAAQEVSRALDRCLLGVSDVVLPAHVADASARVFALARTDAVGAEVIRRRIEDELGRSPRLTAWDLDTNTCFHAIDVGDSSVAEVSDRLQQLMDTPIEDNTQ